MTDRYVVALLYIVYCVAVTFVCPSEANSAGGHSNTTLWARGDSSSFSVKRSHADMENDSLDGSDGLRGNHSTHHMRPVCYHVLLQLGQISEWCVAPILHHGAFLGSLLRHDAIWGHSFFASQCHQGTLAHQFPYFSFCCRANQLSAPIVKFIHV
jgi:hypothetical protein